MRRAIFLDRDGVINEMVYHAEFGLIDSPANSTEFQLLPGAADAIRDINELGFLAVVITNQPGVAKGKYTCELLDAMQEKMIRELAQGGAHLDGIYRCLHHPEAKLETYKEICECRKPKPGMLLNAAADLDIDLPTSYFVGDGITDVVAGKKAGCKTVLVNSRKCYICDELARQDVTPDYIAKDLADAVAAIRRLIAGDLTAEAQYSFRCQFDCD